MLNFQRTLNTQDSVMQHIIQCIVNPDSTTGVSSRDATPFLPSDQAQKLISSYDEAAKASVDIMNDLAQLGLPNRQFIPTDHSHNPSKTRLNPTFRVSAITNSHKTNNLPATVKIPEDCEYSQSAIWPLVKTTIITSNPQSNHQQICL